MNDDRPADGWMQTVSGKAFYPLNPRLDDIDIEDIAHALGLICRYGGHTRWFYSVAEHCVLMSYAVSLENRLWALLHDATEAYMSDLIRPLKRVMPTYVEHERNLMLAICAKYGLPFDEPAEVKEADTRILRDERTILMSKPPQPWVIDEQDIPSLGVNPQGWTPHEAKMEYLSRFRELTA